MPLTEFAPAKLNLYLHITGKRADGYHLLDSLVSFANIGDEIRLEPADKFSLIIEGPKSTSLQNESTNDNLVTRAARSLAALTGNALNVKLTLIKNLPVASGIGGGSSDAAAALRLLAKHWRLAPDDPRLFQAAAQHGQDVPVCLKIENGYMTPNGVSPGPILPHADIVLVNPNKALPTADVYRFFSQSIRQDFSSPPHPNPLPPSGVRGNPSLPRQDDNPNSDSGDSAGTSLSPLRGERVRVRGASNLKETNLTLGDFSLPAPFHKNPRHVQELAAMLAERHNDLTEPACHLMPEIKIILETLKTSKGCLLAHMSGSGATCFGLYPDRASARSAAADVFAKYPDWWVVAGVLPYLNG